MTRSALLLAGFSLALTACAPAVPDSGVGFEDYGDYSQYRNQRDDVLNGRPNSPAPATVRPPNPAPVATPDATAATTTTESDPGDTLATPINNPNISDENDFAAVSNRQSIESDAERLRAQREAYQVIQPTAVPTRRGNSAPNIVQYALTTTHPVGQKLYRRSIVASQKKYTRACAGFASVDLAQEAFLAAGGPERDKLGLDPDGDGYACTWDPAPFRRLAASNG